MSTSTDSRYDVVIVGAGLAGLTLARHLLLYTDKTVLLLDKRENPPGPHQKVGESLVQLSGYYFSKVLDLEEYLLRNHYLKYNLRFHWPTQGKQNKGLEDYSRSFIRLGSNLATFQLDRNHFEAHVLAVSKEHPRFRFLGGLQNVDAELNPQGEHKVTFAGSEVMCDWVVDCSGRGQFLKRKMSLAQPNNIRHGSTWCWVEGLVNLEKLTGRSWTEVRVNRDRMKQGNMPFFLSTNHFCAEGMWFWIIPLHGITSLGLVYDKAVLDSDRVSTARKMLEFVCEKWPIFQRDLPNRKVVDEGRYYDFSYDARQTISAERWAMSGEAGRFSDPLYSPGSDLISIYNTLIVDAIQSKPEDLKRKEELYELTMRVMYSAYVPSYAMSYDCLGDRQAFTYKYGWELAIYFGFYVVPFINDLFADEQFLPHYLRKFGLLGPLNRNLQKFLSDFYRWRQANAAPETEVGMNDFYEMPWLRDSETLFYKVGLTREEVLDVLDMHFQNLRDFARWIVAQVYATVLGNPEIGQDMAFREKIRVREVMFNPEKMRMEYLAMSAIAETVEV
ncbi:MAG: NAD(P)-binding protein [Bryobacteraceae bacterium]